MQLSKKLLELKLKQNAKKTGHQPSEQIGVFAGWIKIFFTRVRRLVGRNYFKITTHLIELVILNQFVDRLFLGAAITFVLLTYFMRGLIEGWSSYVRISVLHGQYSEKNKRYFWLGFLAINTLIVLKITKHPPLLGVYLGLHLIRFSIELLFQTTLAPFQVFKRLPFNPTWNIIPMCALLISAVISIKSQYILEQQFVLYMILSTLSLIVCETMIFWFQYKAAQKGSPNTRIELPIEKHRSSILQLIHFLYPCIWFAVGVKKGVRIHDLIILGIIMSLAIRPFRSFSVEIARFVSARAFNRVEQLIQFSTWTAFGVFIVASLAGTLIQGVEAGLTQPGIWINFLATSLIISNQILIFRFFSVGLMHDLGWKSFLVRLSGFICIVFAQSHIQGIFIVSELATLFLIAKKMNSVQISNRLEFQYRKPSESDHLDWFRFFENYSSWKRLLEPAGIPSALFQIDLSILDPISTFSFCEKLQKSLRPSDSVLVVNRSKILIFLPSCDNSNSIIQRLMTQFPLKIENIITITDSIQKWLPHILNETTKGRLNSIFETFHMDWIQLNTSGNWVWSTGKPVESSLIPYLEKANHLGLREKYFTHLPSLHVKKLGLKIFAVRTDLQNCKLGIIQGDTTSFQLEEIRRLRSNCIVAAYQQLMNHGKEISPGQFSVFLEIATQLKARKKLNFTCEYSNVKNESNYLLFTKTGEGQQIYGFKFIPIELRDAA